MIEHFANAYKITIIKEIEQLTEARYDSWSIGIATTPEELKDVEKADGFMQWDCLSVMIAAEIQQIFLEKGMSRTASKRKRGHYVFVHRTT